MRILGIFDDHFLSSLPLSLGATAAAGGVWAWLTSLDWAALATATGLLITTVGGAGIGLYRQWKLTGIEIRERERRLTELAPERIEPADLAEELRRYLASKESKP